MKMNKNVLGALVCAALLGSSMSAMADPTEKTASASWDVSAVKDSTAGIVITPTGELNFIYNPVTKTWNSQKAPFDLALLAPADATSFTLQAQIGSGHTLSQVGNPAATYDVVPRASSVELTRTEFQDIFEYLPNLSTMTGMVAEGESASTWFNVDIKPLNSAAGVPATDESAMTDGTYKGTLDVDFKAVWEVPAP
ncbi:common pilus major fimbrillin subunit EcpA [Aeromonas enteropelogenes]|uniref:common pilus major fimbrillin subunit EcpA n=1 Tax=Aeromonas enteropelogenes TaxID=29489 RepID=UPI003BA2AB6D